MAPAPLEGSELAESSHLRARAASGSAGRSGDDDDAAWRASRETGPDQDCSGQETSRRLSRHVNRRKAAMDDAINSVRELA